MAGLTFQYVCSRSVHVCVLVFLFLSVLDTTNLLIISPLVNTFSRGLRAEITPPPWLSLGPGRRITFAKDDLQIGALPVPISVNAASTEPNGERARMAPRRAPVLDLQHPKNNPEGQAVLSGATSGFHYTYTNVFPYFYRAQGSFDPNDVTITTLITSNRFRVFARLVEKYQGPISVTVHINESEDVHQIKRAIRKMFESSKAMLTYVDLHLVVDPFDRQFNAWRNVARKFARTNYVMMLDIDFYPCTDLRHVQSAVPLSLTSKFRDGQIALVIPAFEYADYEDGIDYRSFPSNKKDLLSLVAQGHVGMFHPTWGPGHSASDYKRFYSARPGDVYRVTKYQPAYEPYVIFKKDGPPWCDERFVGYGGNKAACLFELYLSGVSFHVMADHFIIHQNHAYPESIRRNERKYNRKVYSDFKEEICLRYLKKYHNNHTHSTIAVNALAECKKIRSVVRLAPQYF